MKVFISGIGGRMGDEVVKACLADSDIEIVGGYDLIKAEYPGVKVYSDWNRVDVKADVIIDFSHPSTLTSVLDYAKSTNTPAIICTTGLSAEQKAEIGAASKDVAIFFSANMSLGVNVLVDLVKKATKVLEENFDIEIIEKHHNQKIDAPSGTALTIADAIAETLTNEAEYTYDRHSVRKKRAKNEIGIHSLRGGSIVGEHSVIFAGQDEIIEIKHTATSKEVFAVGAVKAAKFLAGKPAGMYDMNDLISQ